VGQALAPRQRRLRLRGVGRCEQRHVEVEGQLRGVGGGQVAASEDVQRPERQVWQLLQVGVLARQHAPAAAAAAAAAGR
jgi:hypothetical protein